MPSLEEICSFISLAAQGPPAMQGKRWKMGEQLQWPGSIGHVQSCVELPRPDTLDHSKTLTDESWKSKYSFPGLAPKDLS